MKITTRVCDLCRNPTKGKLATLVAPKKWAAGEYEEPSREQIDAEMEGNPVHAMLSGMFHYRIVASAEDKNIQIDICRHCFKALFEASAWMRQLLETIERS
jgi:hypothetical protein